MYEGRRSAITNVTTELALWRYDNAFLVTNQSEVDFGIALVIWRINFTHHVTKPRILAHAIFYSYCFPAHIT